MCIRDSYSLVQCIFRNTGRVFTEFFSEFQAVDAAPYNLLTPMNVPSHPPIITATVSTYQPFGQCILTGEFSSICFRMFLSDGAFAFSSCDFFLNLMEHFSGDNSRMIVFYVILR